MSEWWSVERGEVCAGSSLELRMCAGWHLFYLPCKYATQANDDQDVEDGWAHDGAHADVSFGDENTCG